MATHSPSFVKRLIPRLLHPFSHGAVTKAVSVDERLRRANLYGSGLVPTPTDRELVDFGAKGNAWAYRCISIIEDAFSSLVFKPYRRTSDGRQEEVPFSHPLAALLRDPNPKQTSAEFLGYLAVFLLTFGRVFIEPIRFSTGPRKGTVGQMWLVPPYHLRLKTTDARGFPETYEQTSIQGNTLRIIKASDLIEIATPSPLGFWDTTSPLQAGWSTILTEEALNRWNRGMVDNSSVASGFFSLPGLISETQHTELENAVKRFSEGDRHTAMILSGGAEWKQFLYNQKDMDFARLKGMNAREICALFGVAPELAGVEGAKFTNYRESRMHLFEDRILTLGHLVAQILDRELTPDFVGRNLLVGMDTQQIPALRPALKAEVEMAVQLDKAGFPLNDINRRLGLKMPIYKWGDSRVLHSGQQLFPVPEGMEPTQQVPAATTKPRKPKKKDGDNE